MGLYSGRAAVGRGEGTAKPGPLMGHGRVGGQRDDGPSVGTLRRAWFPSKHTTCKRQLPDTRPHQAIVTVSPSSFISAAGWIAVSSSSILALRATDRPGERSSERELGEPQAAAKTIRQPRYVHTLDLREARFSLDRSLPRARSAAFRSLALNASSRLASSPSLLNYSTLVSLVSPSH